MSTSVVKLRACMVSRPHVAVDFVYVYCFQEQTFHFSWKPMTLRMFVFQCVCVCWCIVTWGSESMMRICRIDNRRDSWGPDFLGVSSVHGSLMECNNNGTNLRGWREVKWPWLTRGQRKGRRKGYSVCVCLCMWKKRTVIQHKWTE